MGTMEGLRKELWSQGSSLVNGEEGLTQIFSLPVLRGHRVGSTVAPDKDGPVTVGAVDGGDRGLQGIERLPVGVAIGVILPDRDDGNFRVGPGSGRHPRLHRNCRGGRL